MAKKYIGIQEILQEEENGNIVKVTLKTNQEEYPGIGETEVVEYEKSTLALVKTSKPNTDLTSLLYKRCNKSINEIVLILMGNCAQICDMEHIFQSVINTIKMAEAKKDRKLRGVSENNWNVYQLKTELLKDK